MFGQLIQRSQPAPQEPIPLEVRPMRREGTLEFLDLLSYFMDRRFQVPGTNFRFGVNSLLLLVPVIGEVVPAVISFIILSVGLTHYKVPRVVAARMTVNALVDGLISLVPVVGNVWDVFFKSDTRNVNLLREYVNPVEQPRPLWHHWLFLGGALAGLVLVIAIVALAVVGLVTVLAQGLSASGGRGA